MNLLIQQFLDFLTDIKRRSSHTVISYGTDLNSFNSYIIEQYEITEISGISHLMIRSWLVSMKSQGLTNISINRKISSLKTFYKYLRQKEIVKINPMTKVLTLKKSKRLPSFVPKQKMEYLLEDDIVGVKTFSQCRDDLIITLLYMTGVRRSELINIKHENINRSRLEVKVLGKGNKERLCPITAEIIEKIDTYLERRMEECGILDHDYLIVTDKGKPAYPKLIFNVVTKALKAINASERTSPHVLRHTFATHLSSNGAELNAVKELLGHASLAATQVYTHNTIDRLKNEYKKAHPKGE
jgi:integrase/recombinase XerC